MPRYVDADPYPWPYDGDLRPENTVLLVIDMQTDFCGVGGYVDTMGYDLSLTRAPIAPIRRVLDVARAARYHVMHTREGHRPDLSDLPANKRWRSQRIGAGIGDPGPCGKILVRGEAGWELIPELAPLPGETVIDKPGKGSFYATDLDLLLRRKGIQNIALAGITTDVCVHTTMRDANDRGYECLLLSDCTGATDEGNHQAALKMITMQGGVFGAVADSTPVHRGGLVIAIDATPYAFELIPEQCALLIIDMQRDFLEPGGFGEMLGNDVSQLRRTIDPNRTLLAAWRAMKLPVLHTREGHRPDLSDLPPAKKVRGRGTTTIGDAGPMGRILVRGEAGHDIIPELYPQPGEPVIDKPGKGAFFATDLHAILQNRGVTQLVVTGVTTEVCVNTTVREANDRGYDCLVPEDCVGSYFPEFQLMGLKMIAAQGGIFGWVSHSSNILAALEGTAPC